MAARYESSGFIPNVTFGGLGTSPNMSMNTAMPYKNVNHIFSATQNFSKISGTHTVRTGVYVERTRKDQIQGTNTRGSMSFATTPTIRRVPATASPAR